MDQIQQQVKCCGVTSYKDYFGNKTTGGNSTVVVEESVPKSCCIDPNSKTCAYANLMDIPTKDMGIYTKVSFICRITFTLVNQSVKTTIQISSQTSFFFSSPNVTLSDIFWQSY